MATDRITEETRYRLMKRLKDGTLKQVGSPNIRTADTADYLARVATAAGASVEVHKVTKRVVETTQVEVLAHYMVTV